MARKQQAAAGPSEIAKRAEYDEIEAINAAPKSLDELYRAVPQTREMVQRLREIGVEITDDPLTEETYWYDGKLAATFFARYRESKWSFVAFR